MLQGKGQRALQLQWAGSTTAPMAGFRPTKMSVRPSSSTEDASMFCITGSAPPNPKERWMHLVVVWRGYVMHWRTTKKFCIEKTILQVDEVPAAAEGKVTLRRDGVVLPIGCPRKENKRQQILENKNQSYAAGRQHVLQNKNQ